MGSWTKTEWFIPSEKKFLWGFGDDKSGIGAISLGPNMNLVGKVPNYKYWFTLIKRIGTKPRGRLTIYKSDNGYPVYWRAGSGLFIYNAKADEIWSFNGATKVRKMFESATNTERFMNIPKSPVTPVHSPTNMGYTKIKFVTESGIPIYTKNSSAYYKSGKGNWIKLAPTAQMYGTNNFAKVNFGQVKNLFIKTRGAKAPSPNNAGYKATNFITSSGNIVYKKNSNAFHKKNGSWTKLASNTPMYHKSNKKFKGAVANFAAFNKTNYKSGNGQNVYKFKNQYYVMKNGKFTAKFKGKAKLPALNAKTPVVPPAPVVVPVPVQVPYIPPEPKHVVAPKNTRIAKLGLLLKRVAAKKKQLKKPVTKNFIQNYCKNKNKGIGYMTRTSTINFKYPAVDGMGGTTGPFKPQLDSLTWSTQSFQLIMKYDQVHFAKQLVFKYFPTMKNFNNFKMDNVMDMEWFQKQNKWLKTLTPREIFLLYGYSHNGDVWAHTYLDGNFDMQLFKNKLSGLSYSDYFALFFQARDFYKMASKTPSKDYDAVLARVRQENDPKNIKAIIQMFIDELNALIQKAPSTTKPFTVFRGVKDDRYLTGIKDKQYTLNRFVSTSIDGDGVARERFSGGHTVQRILIMPGSKCVCMFGLTRYRDEKEILLPRGSTYIVRKTENNATPLAELGQNMCPGQETYNTNKKVNKLVDIILLGMSKKFVAKTKTTTVPVAIPPQYLANVEKMQRIFKASGATNNRFKFLNKIGQGGTAAIFKMHTPYFTRNVALKLQKANKNFETEVQALKNLKNTKVTPALLASQTFNWSQNASNLIPKGLPKGTRAGIIMMNMVENGKPLRNYMKGPPLNKNLKNKITNAVGKVSAKGWLHGNLHRNNVLINANGNPILIDFGKALKGSFTTTNGANAYLKGLGKGHVEKYGKKFYYSNNAKTRSHYSNKNFLSKIE